MVFVLNFNVGVLGHVDSGKTSLAKTLSTTASTACFDKNPQSKERGITIDLGFSSFCLDLPDHLRNDPLLHSECDALQITLVDCPGHSSLIRTIIGGAQIIDLMILVVDVTKGMQTQTAECLVIGEITCDHMVVVLNKIDLLPKEKRESMVEKMSKKMLKTLEKTKFAECPIVPVAANPGGSQLEGCSEQQQQCSLGVKELIDVLCRLSFVPKRSSEGPLVFSVDHCFSIKGQGTVMTGTIIQGKAAINDTVEIPSLKVSKKIKSMQMFRKPVDHAKQGDRVGICVTQFDPKLLERGIVCSPNYIIPAFALLAIVHKIPYYKSSISTKAKFHISVFHDTVLARCTFFGLPFKTTGCESSFDYSQEHIYQDELIGDDPKMGQYVLIELEHPIPVNQGCLLIGSKLDTDIHANLCRLAFHGRLLEAFTDKLYNENVLPKLKVFKTKVREGIVERMVNTQEVIVRSLFKKETNIQNFTNLKIQLTTGETGAIEGGFGQSGKAKIRIPNGLYETTVAVLASKKKGKGKDEALQVLESEAIKCLLKFKRFVYDPKKTMQQS